MKNKKYKILVTGGAGFIASNITDAYVKLGHTVIVVDNMSHGKKENLNPAAKFYKADITDCKGISRIFGIEKPDIVNHHAAQIDVRMSVAAPSFDAGINIIGSLNILENCRKNSVKKFIFSSSGGAIYGECGKTPPEETFATNPLSPYGVSKRAVEHYLNYYCEIFGLKYTSLRYGNVYGPRQDSSGEGGVISIFTESMIKNKKIKIFGSGKQLRDYVYVGDVVDANVASLEKGANEIINVSTGKTYSVDDVFKILAGITGYSKLPVYAPERTGEIFESSLGVKKAKKILNWSAKTDLASGIRKTYEYSLSVERGNVKKI